MIPAGAAPPATAVIVVARGVLPELGDALRPAVILCGVTFIVLSAEADSFRLFLQVTVSVVVVCGDTFAEPDVLPPVSKLAPVEVVESAQVHSRVVDSPWIMLTKVAVKLTPG